MVHLPLEEGLPGLYHLVKGEITTTTCKNLILILFPSLFKKDIVNNLNSANCGVNGTRAQRKVFSPRGKIMNIHYIPVRYIDAINVFGRLKNNNNLE